MANELTTTYTAKQLPKLIAYFGDHTKSGYKPYKLSSGITSWCLLAAHARPSTHAQAQVNAKAIMAAIGINEIDSAFNASSAWHGSPRSKAIVYKADGPLARYSAAARTPIGNFVMRCMAHPTTRLNCDVSCEQGLYNSDAGKWLGELALGLTIGKASKPTGKRKVRKGATTPKADEKPATSDVNEHSEQTAEAIKALSN